MENEDKNSQMEITIIGSEMQINGKLFSNDDIRIDGKFVGELQTNGKIVISKEGYFEGILKAKDIVVFGKAKGDFEADNKFKISEDGYFKGSIKTRYINITESAHFNGICNISQKHKDIVIVQSESNSDPKRLKSTKELEHTELEFDKQLKSSLPTVSSSDDEKIKSQAADSTDGKKSENQSLLTSKISQIKSI
jgi:cytoskeletal protein CcmA (bactofilin family)